MKELIFLLFIKIGRLFPVKGFGIGKIFDYIYERLKPDEFIVMDISGNKMHISTKDKGTLPALIKNGSLPGQEFESLLFKDSIKKSMTVIDIGANIGYYTLIAAQLVGSGTVYAFEPEPDNYKILCKNIKINNYDNVVAIQQAVSNKKGRSEFYIDKFDISGNSLSFATRLDSSNKSAEINSVWIETITLDDFFSRLSEHVKIDIIKMNAEGAEGLVFEGAKATLTRNKPKVFMEFWPFALKNLGTEPVKLLYEIRNYGFKLHFINEKFRTLDLIEDIDNFCEKAMNLNPAPHLLLKK
jgi:FkbM family methyltransferase